MKPPSFQNQEKKPSRKLLGKLLEEEPHNAITRFPAFIKKEQVDALLGKHAPLLLSTKGLIMTRDQIAKAAQSEPSLAAKKHPQTAPLSVVWRFNKEEAIKYRWEEFSDQQIQKALLKLPVQTMTYAWSRVTPSQANNCWMLTGRKAVLAIARATNDQQFKAFLLKHPDYTGHVLCAIQLSEKIKAEIEESMAQDTKNLLLRIFNMKDPLNQINELQDWKEQISEILALWI
jgi:hypothetical protein